METLERGQRGLGEKESEVFSCGGRVGGDVVCRIGMKKWLEEVVGELSRSVAS